VAVGAAIALAVVLRKHAPPEPARLLPGADGYFYVNLKWVRRANIAGQLPDVPRETEYQEFIQATGFQFERDLDQAAAAVGEGQACVERNGEHWAEAELYRIEGELLLLRKPSDPAGAEARFLQAREVARQQHAKSYELRAATSLARLWQSQGKAADARIALGEICGWFTEGLGTPDLKDARQLLGQLA
jgi:predicted ATPase